jgi:hypothetical protein
MIRPCKTYAVTCDLCGRNSAVCYVEVGEPEGELSEAQRQFYEEGWTVKGSQDVCPWCKGRAKGVLLHGRS